MNTSLDGLPRDDPVEILRCWRHQYCNDCLGESKCSWCPFSQSCVPNHYTIPPLAPAYDEEICPHWSERWEIRTQPLGCQVSTITSLTSLVTIASTLLFVFLVWLLFFTVRRIRRYTKQHPGWWAIWRYEGSSRWPVKWRGWFGSHNKVAADSDRRAGEEEPLLGTA